MRSLTSVLAYVLLFLTSAICFAQLSLAPASLPPAFTGENYYQELQPSGGSAPYTWSVRGKLPTGITFDSASATLAGIPTSAGEYQFDIVVTDDSRRSFTRRYTLHVTEGTGITISWVRAPSAANGGISGEVEISNVGPRVFDLTFIAVAVNEIGRATALGYQHFSLGTGKQRIPFSSALPRGTYVVHADAIGEIAPRTIRRARLQSQPLALP